MLASHAHKRPRGGAVVPVLEDAGSDQVFSYVPGVILEIRRAI